VALGLRAPIPTTSGVARPQHSCLTPSRPSPCLSPCRCSQHRATEMRKPRKPLLDEFHKRFYAIVAVEDVRRMDLRLESTSPWVSTSRCRFLPFTFLPASKPRSSPPTPVVLTLWLSTMPAVLGCGFFPSGHAPRGAVPRSAPPKCRRCARGGSKEVMVDSLPRRSKSCGSKRQVQPPRTT
jgi:hypothetical protein